MKFGLSDDQIALVDTVSRYLTDNAPLDNVRQYADGDDSVGDTLWSGLTELGVPALIIPEDDGGVGLKMMDAALVAQHLGYHVVPAPFISTAVITPLALQLAGSDTQKADILSKIATGELRFGTAMSELCGARAGAKVTASGGKLNGKSMFVFDVDADCLLVADDKAQLHLVDGNADGLQRKVLPQVDRTRKMGEVIFNNTPADVLPGSTDPDVARKVLDAAYVMLAADTLGAAQNMLDQAIAYAMQREQFNRVIASFQAVKHMCAQMAADVEPCHAMVWYASHALDDVPEEARMTAMHTKAHLAEVGRSVSKTSTEVHGGMGFTDLVGLHYWFKRIGLNRQVLGSPEKLRREAAITQGLIAA